MAADPQAGSLRRPTVEVWAGRRQLGSEVADIWRARELLYVLIWRDVRVRYKQTAVGVSWAVIQPLATTAVFALVFGHLAKLPSGGVPYPLFAYAGLLCWGFFSCALSDASNSLVSDASLLTKVYFPRVLIPVAAAGADLVDLAIGIVVFGGFMAFYGVSPRLGMLLLCVLIPLTLLLVLGAGLVMSVLEVKYRDVRYLLPFAVQLMMFASPIIYAPTLLPRRWQWAFDLNPLTGLIESFRYALLGRPGLNIAALGSSAGSTVALFCVGLWYFRRRESELSDIV